MFLGDFVFSLMIIVSLNVRGLGRPEKRMAIRKLVKKHEVDCLILEETKVCSNVLPFIWELWGNRRCAWNWVPSMGVSGGLISICNDEVLVVEEDVLTERELAVKLRGVGDGFVWALGNVYGPNVQSKRGAFLDSLSNIKAQWPIPPVSGGDFNMVRLPYEKNRGSSFSRSMELFSSFIDTNELMGYHFSTGDSRGPTIEKGGWL